jgi:hypothetical protein
LSERCQQKSGGKNEYLPYYKYQFDTYLRKRKGHASTEALSQPALRYMPGRKPVRDNGFGAPPFPAMQFFGDSLISPPFFDLISLHDVIMRGNKVL